MNRFWSPIVADLLPYVPGEHPKGQTFVKLNTNESPYGPSPKALQAIRDATNDDLRLYPDPSAADLRQAIATTHGYTADHVLVGNGSDEVLAHAFKAFFSCRKEPILFPDVTYSFYQTYCRLFDIAHKAVPLDAAFHIRPEDYSGPCGGVIAANPNAPTGIAMDLASVERIVTQNPDVVVIIDEAYVDFGTDSAVSLVPHYENLLVVQTFSKSRSLAALRIGMAVGQPHLIQALEHVKNSFNPYSIGRIALVAARAAWDDRDWFDQTRHAVIAARNETSQRLAELGFTTLPSATNFVLTSHPDFTGKALLAGLRERGILVRHFAQDRTRDWVRISIGTPDECAALLTAAQAIVATSSAQAG